MPFSIISNILWRNFSLNKMIIFSLLTDATGNLPMPLETLKKNDYCLLFRSLRFPFMKLRVGVWKGKDHSWKENEANGITGMTVGIQFLQKQIKMGAIKLLR